MDKKNTNERIKSLLPEWARNYSKRSSVPTYSPMREEETVQNDVTPIYKVFDYNRDHLEERELLNEAACKVYKDSGHVSWINIDGINKVEVEKLCANYDIHYLIVQDIISIGQRAKMDEIDNIIFCLLPMLYFNEETGAVESEQVSIVLGKGFLLSFQQDQQRDVFNPVRDKLRAVNSKIRESDADYLCYSLIDVIVDSYFGVIEKINQRIEGVEDDLLAQKDEGVPLTTSLLRREVITLRRTIGPVRELVHGFLRSENKLLDEKHEKYYKDVLDHIVQANEYIENAREMLINLQDLYMNRMNLKMNEVMKIFTMVATLLAPATVIGGIFGMNFDAIPFTHQKEGFYFSVGFMIFTTILMLIFFKRKKWF